MSFTAFTNIITILFCLAVLVQSVRMMRSLRQVREGQLANTVAALDGATAQARSVLSGLRDTLSTEGAANSRTLQEAREIREELNVMIGIANAMAERLIEAASAKELKDRSGKPERQEDRTPSSRRRTPSRQPAKASAPVIDAPANAKKAAKVRSVGKSKAPMAAAQKDDAMKEAA